jgi:hypothetical protein
MAGPSRSDKDRSRRRVALRMIKRAKGSLPSRDRLPVASFSRPTRPYIDALTGTSKCSDGAVGPARNPRRPIALGIAQLALPGAQSEHLHDPAKQASTAQPLQPKSAAIPTSHHYDQSTQLLRQPQVTLVTQQCTFPGELGSNRCMKGIDPNEFPGSKHRHTVSRSAANK